MIEISLFGPTTVLVKGTRLTAADLGGSKPRQLLEMLALDVGATVSKEVLAERLWEDNPPPSYIATLESYVCGLRRRLRTLPTKQCPLVTMSGGYMLDPEDVRVDAVEVRRLLDSRRLKDVERALAMVHGTFLGDDPYATWATKEREAFARRLSESCVAAAHAANEAGDCDRAARLARAAGHERYWSESALHELMRALAGSGNRAEALIEYQTFRASMLEELGVEPSPATQELYLSILRAGSSSGADDVDDVSLLVGLLRHALENSGGARAGGPAMMEVGRMLMARA